MDDYERFNDALERVLYSSVASTNAEPVRQMYRDALARADDATYDLCELRENVLIGLGMPAADVAAMDDDRADSTISYLLSGHAELAAEVKRLNAQLAARSHAACPHCGQSLHGEMLLPF